MLGGECGQSRWYLDVTDLGVDIDLSPRGCVAIVFIYSTTATLLDKYCANR